MATVTTPVKGFNGEVAGVAFKDGVGSTEVESALSYFRRHGYTVDGDEAVTETETGRPAPKRGRPRKTT